MTIQVVPNLVLTSKHKFRFSTRPMYYNVTFVLMSTGGLAQPNWSPCALTDLVDAADEDDPDDVVVTADDDDADVAVVAVELSLVGRG